MEQAKALQRAGCQIIRAAIANREAVRLLDAVKSAVDMPFVADIHFDYRLALEAVAAGADKIRINPGNIGDEGRVRQVVSACKAKGIPIRVGVNSGSLERQILEKYGSPTAEALVESALYHVGLIERCDYDNIVVSIKSSIRVTITGARGTVNISNIGLYYAEPLVDKTMTVFLRFRYSPHRKQHIRMLKQHGLHRVKAR